MRFVMRLEKRSDTEIIFERYQHINDLFQYYLEETDNDAVAHLLRAGIKSATEAEVFSEFVWDMVARINRDEEAGKIVLGSADNTQMLPDLNYEVSKYLRSVGFYSVWERVSERHLSGSK